MYRKDNCSFNIYILADYIVYFYSKENKKIDKFKLHKILYYIYGYIYKYLNIELFSEEFYNWPYGPVIKDLWYTKYEFDKYLKYENDYTNLDIFNNYKNCLGIVNKVIERSFDFTTEEIVIKSKMEYPCLKTLIDDEIKKTYIIDFFKEKDPLNLNFKKNYKQKKYKI